MRLTLVTETFPPEVNGVAMTLGRWVEAFRARGHAVQVIRPRQAGEAAALALVPGLALPFYREVRIGLAGAGHLRRLLTQASTELVHIATEGPLGWAALRAAERLGLPIASSFHTNFDHYAGHYRLGAFETLARTYLRHFHNRTDITLVPSESTRTRLLSQGFQRVEIWSRGVDGALYHPRHRDAALRASLGLGPDDPLLLYVGRLAYEKNLPVLLDAFQRLRERLPAPQRDKLRLALVGGGPLLTRLQAATPAGVVLAGVQRGVDLSRWYASADIFAFPSCSETFGNVVLEAQASGLPVVAFDSPGVNERVTHGQDGLLVPPSADLAEPLAALCQDPSRRRALGLAARRQAERQSWEHVFDGLEQRYLHLLTQDPDAFATMQGVSK
ncbi:MAG: glycosyltransferase family 4 protein [Pseudomonadota bacterium]